MRNRDKPANVQFYKMQSGGVIVKGDGLTKREAAAIAAMQGYRAAGYSDKSGYPFSSEKMAKQTAKDADALFDELDKNETAESDDA